MLGRPSTSTPAITLYWHLQVPRRCAQLAGLRGPLPPSPGTPLRQAGCKRCTGNADQHDLPAAACPCCMSNLKTPCMVAATLQLSAGLRSSPQVPLCCRGVHRPGDRQPPVQVESSSHSAACACLFPSAVQGCVPLCAPATRQTILAAVSGTAATMAGSLALAGAAPASRRQTRRSRKLQSAAAAGAAWRHSLSGRSRSVAGRPCSRALPEAGKGRGMGEGTGRMKD